ncbi:MAG TPA: VCBS repeat-containing protein [Candidatus Hydrogenedentes bacterium]|nr:VCBS repeat-containing protein [Candidatus Hydrogenedentota bacterium]
MSAVVLLLTAGIAIEPAIHDALVFEKTRIGHATFEAAAAFDVDDDGDIDIVSGGYWYEGPEFKVQHKICDVQQVGDYYDDFSDYPMDVNGDGYLDIVTGGFWGLTLRWRENPKGKPVEWRVHEVAEVGNIERNCFYDIDGDGMVEVFPTTSPVHIFKLARGADGKGLGRFEQFTIAQKGGGGHGIGFGDVNGDGRPDIVFSGGWFEAPENPFAGAWDWHPEFSFGAASVPMLVFDVNEDGRNDVIVGQAHGYGFSWWEQTVSADGARGWVEHVIDADRSQYHELQLADIDNDGAPELIAGKRYRAHCGHDPGADDPLGLYYFEINRSAFVRVTLDYGPPVRASGAGIYLWVSDVDGNGWKDVVAPGKEGLYLFKNMGPPSE